ncbi:MAG: tripartite tricarboxylate transporter permease [Oscillospiraceae bacterium]|nr:tripartite tricarboxylate transporter permease [Oscillospiraceae bacterium]
MELLNGIGALLEPSVLLYLLIGVLIGVSFGATPGLDATTGTALLIPITYTMQPMQAIIFLSALYIGGVFGGSITAILFKVPGASEAVMTALDGYPMAQKGQAGKALGLAIMSSSIGGLIGCCFMFLLTMQMARVALSFGPAEYAALAILGLSCISSIGSQSQLKALMSCGFGMLLATVGIDQMSGMPRFTFGNSSLLSGIPLVPVLIGLFAASEVFDKVSAKTEMKVVDENNSKNTGISIRETLRELRKHFGTLIRGSLIGTWIGILPGVGATTASVVSYSQESRMSKPEIPFGEGAPQGIVAAEAANNAAAVGAFIPMLSLGIPGSATTAVLVGAFLLHGISVGPLLFVNQKELVYSIFGGIFLSNFLIVLCGLFMVRVFIKFVKLPYPIMATSILTFCVVGSLSVAGTMGVVVMFGFGFIGYAMNRARYPIAPVILGLILGQILEANMRRGLLLSQGSLVAMISRPITVVLLLLALFSFAVPYIGKILRSRKHQEK